jgi:addiction module RelE/StbE family toxin
VWLVRLRYTSTAHTHLSRIHDYINERNPAAATRVVARIRTAAERLLEQPGMGRTGAISGTREWVVRGLPYIIVYQLASMKVKITGIPVSRFGSSPEFAVRSGANFRTIATLAIS